MFILQNRVYLIIIIKAAATADGEGVMIMEVKHISESEFNDEVLMSKGLVLVDFYADWCGPCKMLGPILEDVAQALPDLKVVKINTDDAQSLSQEYGVMSIPTVYLFSDGMKVNKFVGVKSKNEIMQFVESA